MMTIVVRTLDDDIPPRKTIREFKWKVGDTPPIVLKGDYRDPSIGIIEVEIEGLELDFVKKRFVNFVFPYHKNTVRIFGDDAKFIVANL